jgi:hypothetical protein
MKTTIIFLLLFVLPLLSLDFDYSLERIDVNFNGITHNEQTIICYGTGSMILSSHDFGNTWHQQNIHHDSLDIRQIIFFNDKFFAILIKDYLVIGNKNADEWHSYYTGISFQESVEANNNNIFILSNNKIYVFDDNILLTKTITINDTNKFTELKIFKGHLLATGNKGKIISIDLNNSYKQELIDFQLLGICSDCPRIIRPIVENNKLFISFGIDVFSSEDLKNWIKVAGNLTYLYNVRNDNLFTLKTKSFILPSNPQRVLLLNAVPVFTKYSNNTNPTVISKDWVQRNVDMLVFMDFSFVNDTIVVAVGRDKLIAISKDGGKNWNLKSNFKAKGFRMVNDSLFYSVKPEGRIYKTLNAGITWLPPLYTDTLVSRLKNIGNFLFDENGYGFVIYDVNSYNFKNLLVTYDYGNTYELRYNKILNITTSTQGRKIIKTDTGYNIIIPDALRGYKFTSIIKLDTALSLLREIVVDSIQILDVKRMNVNTYIGLAQDKRWPYNTVINPSDSLNYLFVYSNDDGLSWKTDFEIYMKDTILKPSINILDNKLLIGGVHFYENPINGVPNINQLYLIDLETKKRTRIFNDIESTYSQVTQYNNYLMIGGMECILVNTDFNEDPLHWIKLPFKGKYISSIQNKSGHLYFVVWDIISHKSHSYNVSLKTITDVKIKVNTKTYLYSYPPYPNPAKNFVRTKIYWDQRYDINKADISIYDYLGNKIAGQNELNLTAENNYSGILSWDCSKYDSGVYFIFIKHGDATRSIPVIVSR